MAGKNKGRLGAASMRTGATWSQQSKLTAADAAQGDKLGTAVALSDDTALIGAPLFIILLKRSGR